MSINHIETVDLRRMEGKDGLILQGCGGELQEWLDGINEMFTEAGILKNGAKFQDISAFEYDGLTCLLYPFEGVDLEIGKLAVWRLQTHDTFGGTWLSDFVPNRLGGFIGEPAPEPEKPDCALIGQDGNIFNLVGIAARTLRGAWAYRPGKGNEGPGICFRQLWRGALYHRRVRQYHRYGAGTQALPPAAA